MTHYYNKRKVTKDELLKIFIRYCKDHQLWGFRQLNPSEPLLFWINKTLGHHIQYIKYEYMFEDFFKSYNNSEIETVLPRFNEFLERADLKDKYMSRLQAYQNTWTDTTAILKRLITNTPRGLISGAFNWPREEVDLWATASCCWRSDYNLIN
jgi:hypothetical protein